MRLLAGHWSWAAAWPYRRSRQLEAAVSAIVGRTPLALTAAAPQQAAAGAATAALAAAK